MPFPVPESPATTSAGMADSRTMTVTVERAPEPGPPFHFQHHYRCPGYWDRRSPRLAETLDGGEGCEEERREYHTDAAVYGTFRLFIQGLVGDLWLEQGNGIPYRPDGQGRFEVAVGTGKTNAQA